MFRARKIHTIVCRLKVSLNGKLPYTKGIASLELKDAFGKVLKQHRNKAGLSQENLAFDAGFNRTFISMLERGLRQPSLSTLFKLGKILNISPSELVKQVEQEIDL